MYILEHVQMVHSSSVRENLVEFDHLEQIYQYFILVGTSRTKTVKKNSHSPMNFILQFLNRFSTSLNQPTQCLKENQDAVVFAVVWGMTSEIAQGWTC